MEYIVGGAFICS